tara:strand:- start:20335 stop:20685 length:351 start_codon:yes stop_codon:yes gene_type:complete
VYIHSSAAHGDEHAVHERVCLHRKVWGDPDASAFYVFVPSALFLVAGENDRPTCDADLVHLADAGAQATYHEALVELKDAIMKYKTDNEIRALAGFLDNTFGSKCTLHDRGFSVVS